MLQYSINHILRNIDTEQNIFNMKNEYIRYSKKEIVKDVIKEWLVKYEFKREKYKM